MKRLSTCLAATVLAMLACAVATAPAMADFGFKHLDVTFDQPDGSAASQAGSHPFEMTTTLDMETTVDPKWGEIPDQEVKDLVVEQAAGLVGNPTATPRCAMADFQHLVGPSGEPPGALPDCPNSTAVGLARLRLEEKAFRPEEANFAFHAPVYNLVPPPGVAARLGFVALLVPVTVDIRVSNDPPYNVVASLKHVPQVIQFFGSRLTLWGNPVDSGHDRLRGNCLEAIEASEEPISLGSCPVNVIAKPFLTLPRSCQGPLTTRFSATSWQNPGAAPVEGRVETHDGLEPPTPQGMTGCGKLGFGPTIGARPTSSSAESPTGLDFDLNVKDEGLTNPTGLAQSDVRKVVATLPEGMTVNPSAAENLAVCTPADLARESVGSAPGEGCPEASKLGSIQVETPLLENEPLTGALYQAQQDDPRTTVPGAENPFDSMLAIYIVIKNPKLGIVVKQAGKVEPDRRTGQLVSTFEDIPQLPFSHFELHFREGPRSPLVNPPGCGTYTTTARLTPWAGGPPVTASSSFEVSSGVGGGPCPAGGVPPFAPGFEAGSLNNNAGSYSPFTMRLTRRDGEQDMTRFDSVLPPGVTGKIAGLSKCPEGAIAAAKAKSGREELASPSCPPSSRIGRVLAGAGVGSSLTYVPGQVYLGGPFAGDPLSVVAITPAVAGPFDVGTVVVREALSLDPNTAEVQVDGAASDPLPHILAGIPLKLRDLRVFVDRERFILNPTSCDPSQVRATLFGGFADAFSAADDVPVSLSARYQASNCASLPFKPKLALKLSGGTKRGGHPALKAVLSPRPGDANIGRAVVTLPRSAFLDQAHIRTICTRVQFAAEQCPTGSIYGKARAFTPLLDEPLEGPVYLRSSNHALPDLVVALHGVVDFDLVGRIDSVDARIRSSFETPPDAPVSRFVLEMQGGRKGLIVNSRNLCAARYRARAQLAGQNGVPYTIRPLVQSSCPTKEKGRKDKRKRRGAQRKDTTNSTREE